MSQRPRQIRQYFYRDVVVLGVPTRDLKYVFAATAVVFFAAALGNVSIYGLNLAPILAVATFFLSSSLFGFLRYTKRPMWLRFFLADLMSRIRRDTFFKEKAYGTDREDN